MNDISITYKPKGYRDLYWCNSVNEPFIVQYIHGTDIKICSLCDRELDEFDEHIFLLHVVKGQSDDVTV